MSTAFDSQIKSILQPLSSFEETNGDPVLAAVQANDANTLRILVQAGYSLSSIDPANGRSLLHIATYLGHVDVVRRLLKEGLNTSLHDRDGKTPLHVAAAYGYSQILTHLLQYETHVEHVDYDLNTPLHMSCKFGHNECCRLLIYAGANLNPINRDGDTPLHSAIRYKHAGESDCSVVSIHWHLFVFRLYSDTDSCRCLVEHTKWSTRAADRTGTTIGPSEDCQSHLPKSIDLFIDLVLCNQSDVLFESFDHFDRFREAMATISSTHSNAHVGESTSIGRTNRFITRHDG